MKPHDGIIDLSRTALLIIDMQRDFLEEGGFGEILGNDVTKLRIVIEPIKKLLLAARSYGLMVIHTREGHRADMTDVHPFKNEKKDKHGNIVKSIGETGPMGRILIRGEPGHDIISDLYPEKGEPVIDKPGEK